MNYFYDNLKYLRAKKKMSMEKFGEYINQSSANISRWENKNNGITIDVANDVAKRLGYSLGELIEKDLRLEDENYIPIEEKDFVEEIADILKNSNLSEKKQEKILSDIEFYREDD